MDDLLYTVSQIRWSLTGPRLNWFGWEEQQHRGKGSEESREKEEENESQVHMTRAPTALTDSSLTWSWTLATPDGRTLKSKVKVIPLKLTTALDHTFTEISWMGVNDSWSMQRSYWLNVPPVNMASHTCISCWIFSPELKELCVTLKKSSGIRNIS